MKFGSIFTGIGGFDLGFERAGMECAWQVEVDGDCNRVLQRQFPDTERHKDVTTLGRLANVDVLCGGFPCQDLSVAGKRKGLAGERSGLWFEFLRIIGLNSPRWIVIENVPGLLSSDEGRDFAVILRGLVECGYYLAWRIVDAQFYGVAQRRRRVFIVGSLGDGSSAEILFESESVSWNPPTCGEAGQRIARTIKGGARGNGTKNGAEDAMNLISAAVSSKWAKGTGGPAGDEAYNLVAQSLTATDHRRGEDGTGIATPLVAHALRAEGADASEDGTGRGTPIIPIDMRQASRGEKMTNNRPNGLSGGAPGTGIGNAGDPSPTIAHSHVPAVFGVANCFNGYTGGPDDNDEQANHLIAFSSKDHGADAGQIAPTLRSQNFKDSHMNGGGQVAIAFDTYNQTTSDVSGTLRDPNGTFGDALPAVAFTERGREGGANLETQEELSYALRDPQKGMNSRNSIAGQFGVRRLTPRECERLQSFPDDFTRWDANGKEISDSARYRMLGNAVCVNVAEWIGKRIMEIANK